MQRLGFAAVGVTLLALVGFYIAGHDARAAGSNPDAMGIDMNPSGTPANTATTLGSRESCARINENNLLDADEDLATLTVFTAAGGLGLESATATTLTDNAPVVEPYTADAFVGYTVTLTSGAGSGQTRLITANTTDTLTISTAWDTIPVAGDDYRIDANDVLQLDVTVTNIPESDPMITFVYTLNYNETPLTVQGSDPNFLLFSNNGDTAALLDASETLPDANNDGLWIASVIDTSDFTVIPAETGTGVLHRLSISSDQGAAAGKYPLTLTGAAVIDPANDSNAPDVIGNASVTIDQACGVWGNVDCSTTGNPVSATDALKILRFVAGLTYTQTEPCDNIGTGGPPAMGNVDCSTTGNPVSATDALKILRSVAGLTYTQIEPCPDIGT